MVTVSEKYQIQFRKDGHWWDCGGPISDERKARAELKKRRANSDMPRRLLIIITKRIEDA